MTEKEIIVSQAHTVCKNCVFAKFDEKDKKTQVSCSLGKIEQYRKAGVEIIDVQDEDLNFYLVNGRFCMFYRNSETMEKYPKDSWEEIIIAQTKIPYHLILLIEKNNDISSFKRTVSRIKNQAIKPNLVTVINKQYLDYVKSPIEKIKPSEILEILSCSDIHKYSLKNVYDDELTDRALIDLAFDSSKNLPYPFYVVFRTGFDIPEDFSTSLNGSILERMMQVGFAKPVDDINGMVVNKIVHKKYGGNSFGINLEDKIEKYEENFKDFIYEAKDVCPSIG